MLLATTVSYSSCQGWPLESVEVIVQIKVRKHGIPTAGARGWGREQKGQKRESLWVKTKTVQLVKERTKKPR